VLQRLRSDEALQLEIKVQSANSLMLYAPGNKELYSLFWSNDVAPTKFPVTDMLSSEPAKKTNTSLSPAIRWVTAEVKRMKAAGEISERTRITDFAKQLEVRMSKARDDGDKSIKPVGWRHIKNNLPSWGLWPIASIE
jgi:hypothetical protein